LPAAYKYFLMWSNGGETLAPLSYYIFYPLEDLRYTPENFPPETLEFANDKSRVLAFDLHCHRLTMDYPIVSYAMGATFGNNIEFVAENFNEFVSLILRKLQPKRDL
jgi:hypothetical protein